MDSALVSVRDVTRRFGSRTVLEGVSIDVHPGEVLGLMGPNGGGKSTLLLLMAGLVRPTAGEVTVAGLPAGRVALDKTGVVGLITADPGLYPLLTGWENLAFFGELYGLDAATARERATPLLQELGLDANLDVRAGTYSSGMKQKVSLARALLMQPRVLLLDEPTSNLDPLSADTIYRTVRRRADEGLAVVWVTHDLYAAERICDRVALIDRKVRLIETLEGERSAPPPGRLLAAWQRAEVAP